MDKSATGKDACDEVTRESLIAISYTLPEKSFGTKLSSENPNGEKPVKGIDYDGAEKYRSELISISNLESPDIEGQRVETRRT